MTWVEKNIGNVHRIPHFTQDPNSGKMIAIPHRLRSMWLNEIKSDLNVYFIYGELSSIDGIKQSLKNSYITVNLIFGHVFDNQENKDEIIRLVRKYPNRLKIYSSLERPENHGFLIGNNILFEDRHLLGNKYEFATVIENAKPETVNDFISKFNSLKGYKKQLTAEELEKKPIDLLLSKNEPCQDSYNPIASNVT